MIITRFTYTIKLGQLKNCIKIKVSSFFSLLFKFNLLKALISKYFDKKDFFILKKGSNLLII